MNRQQGSLRAKILWQIVPVTVALFLLTSYVTVQAIVSGFSREVRVRLDSEASNFSRSAQALINEARNANAALARNHLTINSIVDFSERRTALSNFYRSLLLPGPADQIVVMTNYRGEPIVSNQRWLNADTNREADGYREFLELQQSWKKPVLQQGTSFIGTCGDRLIIASPIAIDNNPEGAIVSIYPLQDFFEVLLDESESAVTGFSLAGSVFASSNKEVLPLAPVSKKVPAGWIGSKVNVVDVSGLEAIVFQSEKTVSEASRAAMMAMFGYFIVCVLGLVLAISIASWRVTSPLTDLASRFREVHRTGNLALRVSEQGPRELVHLSTAFNQMLEELDRTTVSKETYRTLALVAKYTDNGVVITDQFGDIEWVNDGFTRITGFELDEVVGRKPGEFLQGDGTDSEVVDLMGEAVANHRGFDVEVLNYDKQGNPYWVSIETRPIVDDAGNLQKFIAIEADITQRKNAEAEKARLARELQESARAAGMAEIANGVLHNVGNVLNSINISADLLKQQAEESQFELLAEAGEKLYERRHDLGQFLTEDESGKHFPEFFRAIVDNLDEERAARQREIVALTENVNHVKEIIAFQQAYAKRGGIAESIKLSELIDNVIKMHADRIRSFGIEVRRQYAEIGNVFLDKHKLLQILINLVTNAKHALRDSGRRDRVLTVTTRAIANEIEIVVEDNGHGISQENMAKIFVHGFTTKEDGHGFGLHSSALAAKEMGGSIQVSSPGQGQGAKFVLRVPNVTVGGTTSATCSDTAAKRPATPIAGSTNTGTQTSSTSPAV